LPTPFQLFGPSHVASLALTLVASALAVVLVRRRPGAARPLGLLLATALVVNTLSWQVYLVMLGAWQVGIALPLHLCDIGFVAVVVAIAVDSQLAFELAYYWTLAGALQALVTPDLTLDFPDFAFINLIVGHALALVAVAYLTLGLGRRPLEGSVMRAFVATNVYALAVVLFNVVFGTNYMYLCAKPAMTSLLDYLGPWPWYILAAEPVALGSFAFWYAPYWIAARVWRQAGP
jgi:hypothetical integral membrane protein (TIGR02206 family)